MSNFDAMFRRATHQDPYPWQQRVAEAGLPGLLQAETGTGKTAGAVLSWLYRRRFHSDPVVREHTPHWLVFVLPMRVLVEQVEDAVGLWLSRLGLAEQVAAHRVMGGEGPLDTKWRMEPAKDAVFVGTVDMLVSRALNRGYASSRFAWPIDFGLFSSGCHWVYDEIQLLGPALTTTRQLDGFRRDMGTAAKCTSTWMSATVDPRTLATVDNRTVASTASLGPEDHGGALAKRLDATRTVRRLRTSGDKKRHAQEIAGGVAAAHNPGTLSIAICNTVGLAREVHRKLREMTEAEVVLLHSRFRPADRSEQVSTALTPVDPQGPGRVVVSTQVIEAGVDLSASTLFTEAAPWPSIVQRAGRCNRDGSDDDASLLWAPPVLPGPYPVTDVQAAVDALDVLEGSALNSRQLTAVNAAVTPQTHAVLRRRDLVNLFDTTPDLSANDLDVGPYIREGNDLDVLVCWREIASEATTLDGVTASVSAELCPVPIGDLRTALAGRKAWRHDHLAQLWMPVRPADLRPGMIVLLRAQDGGYSSTTGWNPKAREVVPVVAPASPSMQLSRTDEATEDDLATFMPGAWLTLSQHLMDVEREVRSLLTAMTPLDLAPETLEAAAVAGRFHDIGKVHEVFQDTMRRSATSDEEVALVQARRPLAKSGSNRRPRHKRRHFRHELASALALLGDPTALEGVVEADLVIYLVGAHHGRVRLGIRSLPDERAPADRPDARVALGIYEGDRLDVVDVPGGRLPARELSLWPMDLGEGPEGQASWTRMALGLRDRPDLGPFRLAFLEALVRVADWRASARSGDQRVAV